MYFSPLVKQELARIIPQKDYEQKSELLAFVIMNGRISPLNNQLLIILDNPVMVKVVYLLLKKVFHFEARVSSNNKNRKRKIYNIVIPDTGKTKFVLEQFGLIYNGKGELIRKSIGEGKDKIITDKFSGKDFLRGAFLAGGFVNDPERMYHLEIACPSKDIAQMVRSIMHDSSFSTKISFWQKEWTVYIKKNEQIFEFLRFLGVQRALLNLQDIIARKDLLNTVNRLVNCETANLDKTILSASQQLLFIETVQKNIGLENLPPNLREVAKIRLENPYASIQELANILGGGITKSGIYHRLKKIEQLAGDYL
ncbi:MAG: DNA-binding protein WhiA [Candidatus Atribacteria bacterium]|nr:DNA-binding protein WhiA [Candidatus Atribacteria bacterium]